MYFWKTSIHKRRNSFFIVSKNPLMIQSIYPDTFVAHQDCLISYKGPFHRNILWSIGTLIKEIMYNDLDLTRRVFTVFMEMAQNVYYYSYEKVMIDTQSGIGYFCLNEELNEYVLTIGNLVFPEHTQLLMDRCDYINTLNHNELRQYLVSERKNTEFSESMGARIGLIQIALMSGNPLKLDIKLASNNRHFVIFTIKIAKQYKN